MNIAITTATYQRPDGGTPEYLARALNSIKEQHHQDFKLFLIGDNYEDNDEFEFLATSVLDPEKVYFENLPVAEERSIYTGHNLWCSGGVNAMNTGIQRALEQGFDWIAHLDHDDYWKDNHLQSVNSVIDGYPDANFAFTASTHKGLTTILPYGTNLDGQIHSRAPVQTQAIHSTFFFNTKEIEIRYRDCAAEVGVAYPADADFLDRLNQLEHLKSYFVDELTCFQPQENN